MPVEIRVPQLGESIVEATIAQWLKKPGDTVAVGDELVELETEKVNQVVEAEAAGVLGNVSLPAGATVGVGQVLGTISEAGATVADVKPAVPETVAPAKVEALPATVSETSAIPATPTAQSMAQANGIDISTLKATGPNNRVGKEDVVNAMEQSRTVAPPVEVKPVAVPPPALPKTTPVAVSGRPEERIRMSGKRKAIAANLKQAQNNAAMLTTFNEVDMSKVMEIRKRRKDDFQKKFGVGLGFMSFFTKASIGALKQFPYVNGEIQGDEIVLKKYYDIGIAVGVEDGLVVPIVRDADKMSFAEIEKKIGELAGKAKESKLSISEMLGGTFTITNGGVFGSLLSTPILNYPQVGILGLHAIKERPVVVDGQIVIRPIMMVALSYDHRIIDGSSAVRFLFKIKELIEDPETLLLEG